MHPRLQELLDAAEAARNDLLALLDTLSPEQWALRAPAGGWTIREVVSHLHLVEDSSVRALFRAFRTARDAGLGQEAGGESLLASLDWSRLHEVVKPVEAPPFTRPADEADGATLRERLAKSREGLRTWSAEADGFALTEAAFPHPVLGALNLYQWVLMIALHERRHTGQIRRILEADAGATPFANPAGASREASERYTSALLDRLGDRDPLIVWGELPDAVDALVSRVTPTDARRPERPGKWSIVQVVAHLVDTEVVYAWRTRLIVAEDSPPLHGYDQDRWASRLHYDEEPLETLCAELRVLRGRNLRFVQRLTPGELERTGMHDERGPESAWHIVKLIAAHDLVHRDQIARIKRTLGLGA